MPRPKVGTCDDAAIDEVKKDGDTIGGVVTCLAKGVPAGWGSPVFGKLEADLARAMLSIPACKGFEIGSGFDGVAMRGSEHNDPLGPKNASTSNHAGGTLGGMSSGAPISFAVHSNLFQRTLNLNRPLTWRAMQQNSRMRGDMTPALCQEPYPSSQTYCHGGSRSCTPHNNSAEVLKPINPI